jgi:hypothetical protein
MVSLRVSRVSSHIRSRIPSTTGRSRGRVSGVLRAADEYLLRYVARTVTTAAYGRAKTVYQQQPSPTITIPTLAVRRRDVRDKCTRFA